MLPGTVSSDTDLVAELLSDELAHAPKDRPTSDALEDALLSVLPRLEGAFSFVVTDTERVYGMRDPNGLRPLCLGRKGDAWVLASESPALDIVGAEMVREVEPGELVVLEPGREPRSRRPFPEERIDPRLCLFEFVYFARPDARLYGQSVHHSRVRQGEALAAQAPVEADMVMGVPESGVPAAEGYARASGIPFGQGLVKNRYIGRTFIAPSQEMRALGVRMKFNPLRENIEGRRIVVVDDSVVRGTTQHQLVRMLREAGAKEVHLRLTSPPVRWPCFFGMDFGDSKELLAARLDLAGIQELPRGRQPGLHRDRPAPRRHRRPGAGLLLGLLHRHLPDRRPRRGAQGRPRGRGLDPHRARVGRGGRVGHRPALPPAGRGRRVVRRAPATPTP